MCSAAVMFGCCWALQALVRWKRVQDVRPAARFQASQKSLLLTSVDGLRTEQSDQASTWQILAAAPLQRHSLLKSLTKKISRFSKIQQKWDLGAGVQTGCNRA